MFSRSKGFGATSGPVIASTLAKEEDILKARAIVCRFLRLVAARRWAARQWLSAPLPQCNKDTTSSLVCLCETICYWCRLRVVPKCTSSWTDVDSECRKVLLERITVGLKHWIPLVSESGISEGTARAATRLSLVVLELTVPAAEKGSRFGWTAPAPATLAALQWFLSFQDQNVAINVPCLRTVLEALVDMRPCRNMVPGANARVQRGSQQHRAVSVLISAWLAFAGGAGATRQQMQAVPPSEVLVREALTRVLWSMMDVAWLAVERRRSGGSEDVVQISRQLIEVLIEGWLSVRGLPMDVVVAGTTSPVILRRRLVLVASVARDDRLCALLFGAPAAQRTPPQFAAVNWLSLHLHWLALWIRSCDAATASEMDVELWTSWWWAAFLEGNAVASSAEPLLSEAGRKLAELVGKDTAACDAVRLLWYDRALLAFLLSEAVGGVNQKPTSLTQNPKKKKTSTGLFAELRDIISTAVDDGKSQQTFGYELPWNEASLLRRLPPGSRPEAMIGCVASHIAAFFPSRWMRTASLVALLSTSTVTPLHGLASFGPSPLHDLYRKMHSDTLFATSLDLWGFGDAILRTVDVPSTATWYGTFGVETAVAAVSPRTVVSVVVRRMMVTGMSLVALLAQWCSHLNMVTGDREFVMGRCPLPVDQVHSMVNLCNATLLTLTLRALQPSTVTVNSDLWKPRVLVDVFVNSKTDAWLREDPLRMKQHLVSWIRAVMDRSLRMPALTHCCRRAARKEALTMDELQEMLLNNRGGPNAIYDERFWLLDPDVQHQYFPGSYERIEKSLRSNSASVGSAASSSTKERKWSAVQHALLRSLPHVVPFADRVDYFSCLLSEDRRKTCGSGNQAKLGMRIRRGHLLEDAMEQLQKSCQNHPDLLRDGQLYRMKWHIQFVDVNGKEEAGIDAGGVFKEFMEFVMREVFNPNLGLFVPVRQHDDAKLVERVLHPNPLARHVFGRVGGDSGFLEYFRIAGLLVGKAVYEGVVLNVELAPSFLNAILSRGNTLDDFLLMDPQQFHSLQLLKDMDNIEDAELYFAVDEDVLGEAVTVDLIPNGRNVKVTNDNVVRYLHLMAYYKLVRRNHEETQRFAEGMFLVLPRAAVVSMFHHQELQQLISGRNGLRLDVQDLQKHCRILGGGLDAGCRTLELLWEVLDELDTDDQGRFLQFCTGSSKPPLLGFASMDPPFSIRGVEEGTSSVLNFVVDVDRLPSASTCFNLLKLPVYRKKSNLKEKLLQSIRADSGFQLS